MTDAVILNSTVTRCTLDILAGHHNLERAIPRCHYESVCPTPCNPDEFRRQQQHVSAYAKTK